MNRSTLSGTNPLIDFPARDHVLIGKERTDIGRPHDADFPHAPRQAEREA